MLSRLALTEEGSKGVEYAREAGLMIAAAQKRLIKDDSELSARVDLAEGIWNNVIAIKGRDILSQRLSCAHMIAEQEPDTRMNRITTAISALERSVTANSTASAHHHLAILLSRPGPSHDLIKAIEHARAAVELEHAEIRHWHLLGLLEAATGDWKKARSVLEVGAALGDAALASADGATETANGHGNGAADGVQVRDYAVEGLPPTSDDTGGGAESDSSEEVVVPRRTYLLDDEVSELPLAAQLLTPAPDHPPPSHQELFEHALQLRMTQLALAEYVEGVEGVGDHWTEVFGWFAERKGTEVDKGKSYLQFSQPAC